MGVALRSSRNRRDTSRRFNPVTVLMRLTMRCGTALAWVARAASTNASYNISSTGAKGIPRATDSAARGCISVRKAPTSDAWSGVAEGIALLSAMPFTAFSNAFIGPFTDLGSPSQRRMVHFSWRGFEHSCNAVKLKCANCPFQFPRLIPSDSQG